MENGMTQKYNMAHTNEMRIKEKAIFEIRSKLVLSSQKESNNLSYVILLVLCSSTGKQEENIIFLILLSQSRKIIKPSEWEIFYLRKNMTKHKAVTLTLQGTNSQKKQHLASSLSGPFSCMLGLQAFDLDEPYDSPM